MPYKPGGTIHESAAEGSYRSLQPHMRSVPLGHLHESRPSSDHDILNTWQRFELSAPYENRCFFPDASVVKQLGYLRSGKGSRERESLVLRPVYTEVRGDTH